MDLGPAARFLAARNAVTGCWRTQRDGEIWAAGVLDQGMIVDATGSDNGGLTVGLAGSHYVVTEVARISGVGKTIQWDDSHSIWTANHADALHILERILPYVSLPHQIDIMDCLGLGTGVPASLREAV